MTKRSAVRHAFLALFVLCLPAAAESMLALKVSSPLMVSGAAGLRFPSAGRTWSPSIQAEAGVGGGKILVGGDTFGAGFGLGVKAVLLRTWLEPVEVEPDTTYLGAEFEAGFRQLFAAAGAYARVGGEDNDDLLLGISLGWML
ncbi:MAG TPA: hypothetical protein P5567_06020 [Kiritimatiellia bacterium]|nr:hypothetical protein [Kiritimatiellia bacterium]HRZ11994.1 hypothetical protein [Kiritimatiellia bacterium]HSA17200.1 hypothetical protein [Kiritimatiellia bacterium]